VPRPITVHLPLAICPWSGPRPQNETKVGWEYQLNGGCDAGAQTLDVACVACRYM